VQTSVTGPRGPVRSRQDSKKRGGGWAKEGADTVRAGVRRVGEGCGGAGGGGTGDHACAVRLGGCAVRLGGCWEWMLVWRRDARVR